MSRCIAVHLGLRVPVLPMLLASLVVLFYTGPVTAGALGFRNQAVGGISIDVEGVVGPPSEEGRTKLLAALRKGIKGAPAEMDSPVELRMVSLKGIAAACDRALKEDFGRLPEEVRFLFGLQRIQYVFVYPEENDIVLAGPGEGWEVDEMANVVGVTTGRPVLRLEDLLVALRSVERARTAGISCSINPTEAGNRALRRVLAQQRRRRSVNPPVLEAAIKRAFGPQKVTISGVPESSHFARVLVAADYRMKRLAMKLDRSPVRGLPSYLDMVKKAGSGAAKRTNPRWWLACNYEPLATSEDRLAWELRGPGVKAMTEEDFVSESGETTRTGRTSALAQRWADAMTDQYDGLSTEDVVFGELRNLMDMCVVAALIEKEGLSERAGLQVPLLTSPDSELKPRTWNSPSEVPPEVSFLRARGSWIVTASGGVQIESWQVASRTQPSDQVEQLRQRATPSKDRLWWQ